MKLLGRSHLVAFAAITIMAVGVGAALRRPLPKAA